MSFLMSVVFPAPRKPEKMVTLVTENPPRRTESSIKWPGRERLLPARGAIGIRMKDRIDTLNKMKVEEVGKGGAYRLRATS